MQLPLYKKTVLAMQSCAKERMGELLASANELESKLEAAFLGRECLQSQRLNLKLILICLQLVSKNYIYRRKFKNRQKLELASIL
jgi:hypothetical protein